MNEPGLTPKDQLQDYSHANLLFLLQTLAGEVHAAKCKALLESTITDEQVELFISRHELAL
jgi:hypothetical protein